MFANCVVWCINYIRKCGWKRRGINCDTVQFVHLRARSFMSLLQDCSSFCLSYLAKCLVYIDPSCSKKSVMTYLEDSNPKPCRLMALFWHSHPVTWCNSHSVLSLLQFNYKCNPDDQYNTNNNCCFMSIF